MKSKIRILLSTVDKSDFNLGNTESQLNKKNNNETKILGRL